jgi:adenylylsulfate kinase
VTACVVWLTGLPGSGKTTIAERVSQELRRRGHRGEVLDGDAMRSVFPQTGFSKMERDAHIRRAGYLASRLEFHGVIVVASFVSPYREARAAARALCRTFVEVYVATPLDECERRDVKGMYARARRGEIQQFTGVSDPYEAPVSPELVIDTRDLSVDEAARRVLEVVDASAAGTAELP